jgi:branched-chain amino acid transport system permease protein
MRRADRLSFLVSSFGILVCTQNLIQLIFGPQTLSVPRGDIKEGYSILGGTITGTQVLIFLTSITLAALIFIYLKKTNLGKALRAVADDPIAASVIGINVEQIISLTFFIGSCLAGSAGALISLETNIEPSIGLNAVLKGMTASIIGGISNGLGALLGGFFLGLVENFGVYYIDTGWKDTISFTILIVFLVVQPQQRFLSLRKRHQK